MKIVASPFRSKRGSAMVAVFVISTAIALVLAAILSHSLTERRVNSRHELRLIAKNASEAVVEYGFAQLRHKFENRTNFTESALAPSSSDALSMPPSELFGPSVDYQDSEILGGMIDAYPTTLTYIDPADPANEFDPLRGQKVYARQVALYAKATVNDPRGGPDITSYVTQKMQVRDAPLFAHAIFYNLDLEVSPGPKMEIHGPVHTNGDLYVQGISGVDFHYPVSTAQDMFYGWGTDVGSAQGSGYESLQTGHVKFKNRAGSLVSMKDNGTYMDSLYSKWRVYASNRWNGYLLTQDHGVEVYQPVAFPDYEPDNPATGSYDPVNSGHALIEPPLPVSDPDYSEEVEKQKLSNKAGLYFKWNVQTGSVKAYDENGREYDISHLQGSGSAYLYEIKPNAMYDHRRNQLIDILEFNVGRLKQLIEDPDYTHREKHIAPHYDDPSAAPAEGSSDWIAASYTPSTKWNGIVYFETTTSSSSTTEQERLHYSGIRLWNGKTDPTKTDQGIPSRGEDPGMTFATNNALYVKGDFNADGVVHETWTSQNSAIVPEVGEVPVALYGDSVTILSNNWNGTTDANSPYNKKPQAGTTEVAAAIVSGLIPTNADNNGRSSGGVHNFPRFLESWDNQALYIRGSLVCLYESEVDNSAWRIDYYKPPARNWGFSELFLNGTYPPGTPLLRTYRRINYTNLTEAEYNAAVAGMPWSSQTGEIEEPEPDPDTGEDPGGESPTEDPDLEPDPGEETVTEPNPDPEDNSDDNNHDGNGQGSKKDKWWWWKKWW